MKITTLVVASILFAPAAAMATTVVTPAGGPYDIQSDSLFFGVVSAQAGGAGSYTIDFNNPHNTSHVAVADVAVTEAAVASLYTNLEMAWIDGRSLNTLVQVAGVGTLTTVFDSTYPVQQLQFTWSDSPAGTGFGFDVTSAVPLPAMLPLLLAGAGGLGFLAYRKNAHKSDFPSQNLVA